MQFNTALTMNILKVFLLLFIDRAVFSNNHSILCSCILRYAIYILAASNAGGDGHRELLNSVHGPGSVLVSEIDLSSPLNYGTPSSLGSSTFRTPGANRGTPIRIRSDIQSERRLRQVNVAPGSSQGAPGSARDDVGSESNVPGSGSHVAPSEASEAAPQLGLYIYLHNTDNTVKLIIIC